MLKLISLNNVATPAQMNCIPICILCVSLCQQEVNSPAFTICLQKYLQHKILKPQQEDRWFADGNSCFVIHIRELRLNRLSNKFIICVLLEIALINITYNSVHFHFVPKSTCICFIFALNTPFNRGLNVMLQSVRTLSPAIRPSLQVITFGEVIFLSSDTSPSYRNLSITFSCQLVIH